MRYSEFCISFFIKQIKNSPRKFMLIFRSCKNYAQTLPELKDKHVGPELEKAIVLIVIF